MLLRLQFEEAERKRLKQVIQDRTLQKQKLLDEITKKQTFLNGLKSQVKGMIDASRKLQDYFALKSYETIQTHEVARLLPSPLYILFNQLVAHKNQFGKQKIMFFLQV